MEDRTRACLCRSDSTSRKRSLGTWPWAELFAHTSLLEERQTVTESLSLSISPRTKVSNRVLGPMAAAKASGLVMAHVPGLGCPRVNAAIIYVRFHKSCDHLMSLCV